MSSFAKGGQGQSVMIATSPMMFIVALAFAVAAAVT